MGVDAGPSIARSGLLFAIDAAGPSSISPLGCTGFSGAPQLVRNLITKTDTITSFNDIRLGGVDFYTAFAIDYPESSYGGDAASRQGITSGYNVRAGSKTYDASRALHLWVWNNDTQAWVADSYFTGWALNGHCYDSYVGTAEVDKWVANYNTIKAAFPNCTYIAMGSHRDSYHTAAQYAILKDLGAPSNVDSIINFSSPEWILVGRPGLGAGNAHGWVFQNYTTNSTEVAHLNFGLPIHTKTNTYLEFDGTNDYLSGPNNAASLTGNMTAEAWIKIIGSPSDWVRIVGSGGNSGNRTFGLWYSTGRRVLWQRLGATDPGIFPGDVLSTGVWYHIVATTSGNSHVLYLNGTSIGTATAAGPWAASGENTTVGFAGFHTYTNSHIAVIRLYTTALTAAQVVQNFNAQRDRFGV
jgi:hypothetical protein